MVRSTMVLWFLKINWIMGNINIMDGDRDGDLTKTELVSIYIGLDVD